MLKFSFPNQTSIFLDILANILGTKAYFSKPIFVLRMWAQACRFEYHELNNQNEKKIELYRGLSILKGWKIAAKNEKFSFQFLGLLYFSLIESLPFVFLKVWRTLLYKGKELTEGEKWIPSIGATKYPAILSLEHKFSISSRNTWTDCIWVFLIFFLLDNC